jgi:hypothetical protein
MAVSFLKQRYPPQLTMRCNNAEDSSTYNSTAHCIFLTAQHWVTSVTTISKFLYHLVAAPSLQHSTVTWFPFQAKLPPSQSSEEYLVRTYVTSCMIRTLKMCGSHFVCLHAWLCAFVHSYWLCTTYFLTGSSSQQDFCYHQGIKFL